jgi:hypothetical protein
MAERTTFEKWMRRMAIAGVVMVVASALGTLHMGVLERGFEIFESAKSPLTGSADDPSDGPSAAEPSSRQASLDEDGVAAFFFLFLTLGWTVVVIGLFKYRIWAYHSAIALTSGQSIAVLLLGTGWLPKPFLVRWGRISSQAIELDEFPGAFLVFVMIWLMFWFALMAEQARAAAKNLKEG